MKVQVDMTLKRDGLKRSLGYRADMSQILESGLGCSSVVEVRLDPTELKFGCQTERTDQPNFNNEFSLFFFNRDSRQK